MPLNHIRSLEFIPRNHIVSMVSAALQSRSRKSRWVASGWTSLAWRGNSGNGETRRLNQGELMINHHGSIGKP